MKKQTEDRYDLARFISAQGLYYRDALSEIRNGHKETHWMWFIFPQLKELGFSDTAKYYGISGIDEAKAYWENERLRSNLMEITEALLSLEEDDPGKIFRWPDDLKLKSCMTLFEKAAPECELFGKVLEKYFKGERDEKTVEILQEHIGI